MPLRRTWIGRPYGEEEITILEMELIPAIQQCISRVDELVERLPAAQKSKVMARPTHGFQHWGCNTHLTMAVYFRQPQMLWWIADRLGLADTSDQVQHAFNALVRQGVLRPMIKGVWELETSDPELLQWLLSRDSGQKQHQGKTTSP